MPRPTRAHLTEVALEHGYELIFFDPPDLFDHAIIGLIYGFSQEPVVLYDETRIIRAMVKAGMDEDEAREYFEFNTVGAYLGPATPRFLLRP